ncbi:hypothetical protein ABXN37_14930 [Piscinibacter sakaiensis]|uniref:protein O-GlcNAc transferase n=1 Tax=Piscinibacter sakaiensis TaxID=1547922 RepID=A0A0K8P1A4_PISS1|nr:hypothetical protein [Piscinibacter sakaiensis]GAP36442.1 hypothetical protein ISF6_2282 [Piscinibacter sakaiensis]
MFKSLLSLLRPARKGPAEDPATLEALFEEAALLTLQGKRHAAIKAWRALLERDPQNVNALNDLAACLSDIGQMAHAETTFELAYSLDDRSMPVVVNHAKVLVDQRRTTEALPLLTEAKIENPQSAATDGVYAAYSFQRGLVEQTAHYAKRCWLGNFDNLRVADGFLFNGTYADIDERAAAVEHRFWAETCRAPWRADEIAESLAALADSPFDGTGDAATARVGDGLARRVRIGYLSPDLRSHSVRYFFRPLLENHDRTRFEVFVYNDTPVADAQTALIEQATEHFHETFERSDTELYELVRGHRLDILVELAGHSSHNRSLLLQERFAPLQVTAIGYPPTTGLTTVDAKVIDRHLSTPEDRHHYTEMPLVLPNSFWCFDPLEAVPDVLPPPVGRKGHVSFGCVGNIGKITGRLLAAWRRILDAVPDSRLVLRSINFQDPASIDAMRERLRGAGIDTGRVDCHPPAHGQDFFASYADIDIILDTFPFTGGTTTCFAVFMGVPVVSIVGQSVIGRMGLSILSNLGAADLCVPDADTYVARAVALAGDRDYLERFRREARGRMRASSLGDGRRYAADLEAGLLQTLQRRHAGGLGYQHAVPALPAQELMRRAYAVLSHGNEVAAARIARHCLAVHPGTGSAHVLLAQIKAQAEGPRAAIDELLARVDGFSPADQVSTLLTIVRLARHAEDGDEAARALARLEALPQEDPLDALQVRLFQVAGATERAAPAAATRAPARGLARPLRVHLIVPCNGPSRYEVVRRRIEACVVPGVTLGCERCDEIDRLVAYRRALARDDLDLLLIVQKHVEVLQPRFFERLADALDRGIDLVGCAGATAWQRLDWRSQPFGQRAGCLVTLMRANGLPELRWLGPGRAACTDGLAVLDGSLLAARPAALRALPWDEELLRGGMLLEERWSHAAAQAGRRLASDALLGVVADSTIELDEEHRRLARLQVSRDLGFDPFVIEADDDMALAVTLLDAPTALAVAEAFAQDDRDPVHGPGPAAAAPPAAHSHLAK